MLIKRLLQSWSSKPESSSPAPAAGIRQKDAERLSGCNWLVRGRHGVFVASDNDIYIGRALIHYGEFSELEWTLLQRYCRAGDRVVEVGANIGAHTVSLAKAVGPGGRVVAIEPQQVIFQMLCANIALNCLLNVDTLNCGCGSVKGMMSVPMLDYEVEQNFGAVSLGAHDDARPSRSVSVIRLDDLLHGFSSVDLIKIDVEGMETDVLNGARETIDRFRPALYVENDRVKNSKVLIETIAAMGYRMWWHTPPLYNPDNYYGEAQNLYPGVASFNMLCLHPSTAAEAPPKLKEISDSGRHPLAAPAAS